MDGVITLLSEPVSFEVKSLNNRTLPPTNPEEMLAYQIELTKLSKAANSARYAFGDINDKLEYYQAAARIVTSEALDTMLDELEAKLEEFRIVMYGNPIKNQLEIDQAPSLNNRINTAIFSGINSGTDPTGTSKMVKEIAESQLKPLIESLKVIIENDIPAINAELDRLGAPWTPGRIIDMDDK
jgi:hypothetical protein